MLLKFKVLLKKIIITIRWKSKLVYKMINSLEIIINFKKIKRKVIKLSIH